MTHDVQIDQCNTMSEQKVIKLHECLGKNIVLHFGALDFDVCIVSAN